MFNFVAMHDVSSRTTNVNYHHFHYPKRTSYGVTKPAEQRAVALICGSSSQRRRRRGGCTLLGAQLLPRSASSPGCCTPSRMSRLTQRSRGRQPRRPRARPQEPPPPATPGQRSMASSPMERRTYTLTVSQARWQTTPVQRPGIEKLLLNRSITF